MDILSSATEKSSNSIKYFFCRFGFIYFNIITTFRISFPDRQFGAIMLNDPNYVRGVVMEGGGAKGYYEAGVVHAFHMSEMDFTVITGSSAGALNALFLAEYLYKKRCKKDKGKLGPQELKDELYTMVVRFHAALLLLAEVDLIPDSENDPLGRLYEILQRINVNFSDIIRIVWLISTPTLFKKAVLSIKDLSHIGAIYRVLESINDFTKEQRQSLISSIEQHVFNSESNERTDNERIFSVLADVIDVKSLNMENSALVSEKKDDIIFKLLTTEPLSYSSQPNKKGLNKTNNQDEERVVSKSVFRSLPDAMEDHLNRAPSQLIDLNRTLNDYKKIGLDVRFTRANYRTGKLEISGCFSRDDLKRFIKKNIHYLNWQKYGDKPSDFARLRMIINGNPKAVEAALASTRLPGIFRPKKFSEIYSIDEKYDRETDEENYNNRLFSWLNDESEFKNLLSESGLKLEDLDDTELQRYRDFFPKTSDVYLDGGVIDNLPTNSAIDAVRESVLKSLEKDASSQLSMSNTQFDLFTILLEKEPGTKKEQDSESDPLENLHPMEVVSRTLEIRSGAKMLTDTHILNVINKFGERGNNLAMMLGAILESLKKADIDKDKLDQISAQIIERLHLDDPENVHLYEYNETFFQNNGGEEVTLDNVLQNIEGELTRLQNEKLPMNVRALEIFPDEMNMSTWNFTERLGYRREKALKMLTMGCYNTLWTTFTILLRRKQAGQLKEDCNKTLLQKLGEIIFKNPFYLTSDEKEKESNKIDIESLLSDSVALSEFVNNLNDKNLRQSWNCAQSSCVYWQACAHGKANEISARS